MMFDFLQSMSPWWWVAFGIALGALEMATFTLFLVWPALAALIMAVVTAIFPSMPGTLRLAVFASLAVGLTFAGRSLKNRISGPDTAAGLNRRADRMVGRQGRLTEFENGEGTVEIDGVFWRARSAGASDLKPGSVVAVAKVQGGRLEVTPLPTDRRDLT